MSAVSYILGANIHNPLIQLLSCETRPHALDAWKEIVVGKTWEYASEENSCLVQRDAGIERPKC